MNTIRNLSEIEPNLSCPSRSDPTIVSIRTDPNRKNPIFINSTSGMLVGGVQVPSSNFYRQNRWVSFPVFVCFISSNLLNWTISPTPSFVRSTSPLISVFELYQSRLQILPFVGYLSTILKVCFFALVVLFTQSFFSYPLAMLSHTHYHQLCFQVLL